MVRVGASPPALCCHSNASPDIGRSAFSMLVRPMGCAPQMATGLCLFSGFVVIHRLGDDH